MLSQADVQKVIKKNQEIYSDLEAEVFDKIKAWLFLLGDNTLMGAEDFSIFYPKPQVMTTDTEIINNLKVLLELGIITKKKFIMRLNPNLTDDQAAKELQDVTEEKKKTIDDLGINNGLPGDNQGAAQDQPANQNQGDAAYNN